jgi:hypothetical protein
VKKPNIDLAWVRGNGEIDCARPNIFLVLGMRGSGKSSFLELLASEYLDAGGKVLDLFGSKDGEGLAWLRSPYAKSKRICLLHGDMVEIDGQDALRADKFGLADVDRADIFISASPLYASMDDEFDAVNRIFDVLWRRRYWTEPIFVVVREAANLIYSRIKIRKSQVFAKAEMTYMLRESRHSGLAMGLDSIKHTSIDIDVRTLTDYLVIKNVGMYGLPRDLWWIYKTFDPTAMRKLNPGEFVIMTRRGDMGLGTFEMPSWYKREAENIMNEVGVHPKYYRPGASTDQALELVREALEKLPPGPEPSDVSRWIMEHKGVEVKPRAVGLFLRRLGYASKVVTREGETKRTILADEP